MKTAERSRTGCGRCKERRVKCDETWPTCGRCTRLKVSCSGPALHVRWSNKHELRRGSHRSACSRLPITQTARQVPKPHIGFDQADHQPSYASSSAVEFLDLSVRNHTPSSAFDERDYWMEAALGTNVSDPLEQGSRASCHNELDFAQSLPQQQPCSPTMLDFQYETPMSLALSDNESQLQSTGSPSDLLVDITSTPHFPASGLPSRTSHTHLVQEAPLYTNHLADYRTKLVEFYFRDAALILPTFDGPLNPFRTIIGRFWTSSNLLYATIRSLSAVFLSNIYPQMAAVGANLRKEAIAILTGLDEDKLDEKDLLALFMIGGTASWFDENDIGQEHLSIMSANIQRMTTSGQITANSRNHHFFKDLLVCWHMFLAFVDDHVVGDDDHDALQLAIDTPSSLRATNQLVSLEFPTLHVPHPLTGVGSDIQRCLTRIGRLVRRNRRRVHDGRLDWVDRAILQEMNDELEEATRLEVTLFEMKVPSVEEIVDTGDHRTPTWHLATLANVYRHIGLLLLYRVFHDVRATARRRPLERLLINHRPDRNDRDELEMDEIHKDDNNDNEWLRAFALRIVAALQSIPIDSGTKDFHPFLLVAACSDLTMLTRKRLNSSSREKEKKKKQLDKNCNHSYDGGHDEPSEGMEEGIPPGALDVHAARAFIMGRLQALQFALPSRPIKRCIDIVRAVWEPQGTNECPFWMDVMIQNNWETFMA